MADYDPNDYRQEWGTFYHATRAPWQPGQPLLCWNRLVAAGIRSGSDWQHPKVPVGRDGDLIGLHPTLINARQWARPGETIVRIRIQDSELSKLRDDSEQRTSFPDEIPAAWLEVVETVGIG